MEEEKKKAYEEDLKITDEKVAKVKKEIQEEKERFDKAIANVFKMFPKKDE